MRKPLTLFETLLAAFLAAILFSNLLGSFFRMAKAKRNFSQYKEHVLRKADLHVRLKEITEDEVELHNGILYWKETPLATGIDSFRKEYFCKKEGRLEKVKEWKEPFVVRYVINGEPFTVFLTKDTEGFALCK